MSPRKFFDSTYMLKGFDFDVIGLMDVLCRFDQGVLMTDHQGILVFYNSVQADIDKLNPKDVLGRHINDVYTYHNDSSTCMRVLDHGRPIINYALSYHSDNANVGNTIHSVFPLFKGKNIIGTICFVKDYNILERNIPEEKTLELNHCYLANLLGSLEQAENTKNQKTIESAGNHLPNPPHALNRETQTLEQTRIIEALNSTKGNIAAAARHLSISRQLPGYKIKKLNLRSILNDIRHQAKG